MKRPLYVSQPIFRRAIWSITRNLSVQVERPTQIRQYICRSCICVNCNVTRPTYRDPNTNAIIAGQKTIDTNSYEVDVATRGRLTPRKDQWRCVILLIRCLFKRIRATNNFSILVVVNCLGATTIVM